MKIYLLKLKKYERKSLDLTWKEFICKIESEVFIYKKLFMKTLLRKAFWFLRYEFFFIYWVYKKIIGLWYEK